MTNVLQRQLYISSYGAAINFLICRSSLSFSFRLFYLSTRFMSVLTLKSSAIHRLTCFQVSSGLFLVIIWMLCRVSRALQITTCGTIFMERHFSVSKEWIGSWSHAFLVTYHKTLIKKLFDGTSRKSDEKEKKKKKPRIVLQSFCVKRKLKRKTIAKCYALKRKRKN